MGQVCMGEPVAPMVVAVAAFVVAALCLRSLALSGSSMKADEVVDWRVWKLAVVAADAGIAKAGDHVYVITSLKDSVHGPFSFITPNPIALALEVSIRAAKRATELRAALVVENAAAGSWLTPKSLQQLYLCFQECMIAATFALQGLEAFANLVIVQANVPTIDIERKKVVQKWTPDQVERGCSTEEKLGTIVPSLRKTATIKGTALWERFRELKDLRDLSTHLKSLNQYKRGSPDDSTLYYRLLSADLLDCPRTAIEIFEKYSSPGSLAWLDVPKQDLA